MAMQGQGKTEIDVRIQQWLTGKVHKMVVKDAVKIQRTPNEPSVLTCEILRDKVSPEEGDIITVTIDGGHNCFSGRIRDIKKKRQWASITAYDQLWNLQQNQRRFLYKDSTATEVYKRIIEDNELRTVVDSHIMDTEYKIPYRIENNTTYLDMIKNALQLTYENTGNKFFVWDDFGNLCLHSEEWLSDQPYLQITAGFLEDYEYDEDGTQRKTAVRIENEVKKEEKEEPAELPEDWDWDDVENLDSSIDHSSSSSKDWGSSDSDSDSDSGDGGGSGDDETTEEEYEKEKSRKFAVYTARNDEAVKNFGFLEYKGELSEGENGDFKAKQLLKEHQDCARTLTLSRVQGDIQVRGGTPIIVDFFSRDRIEFIRGWFSVTSVTHTIEHGYHTMDLTLEIIKPLDDWKTDTPDYTFERPEAEEIRREKERERAEKEKAEKEKQEQEKNEQANKR